jgi:hypothetical protein
MKTFLVSSPKSGAALYPVDAETPEAAAQDAIARVFGGACGCVEVREMPEVLVTFVLVLQVVKPATPEEVLRELEAKEAETLAREAEAKIDGAGSDV